MTPRLPPAQGAFARVVRGVSRRQYGEPMVESSAIYALHPRLLRAFALFNRAVEKRGAVPERLKHLAVLKSATVVECEFCIDIGSEHSREAGLSDDQLLALHRAPESGLFSEEELLVLDVATGMSRTPAEVPEEAIATLRGRFGAKGVLELCNLIAWENHRARLNVALGIGAGGFSAGKVCAAPERDALAAAAA